MAYIIVEDFKLGMDRRRKRIAGTPGSLWTLVNGHISRGGDIERRKVFVEQYSVPGTKGLAAIHSQLYVFGSAIDPGVAAGLTYQRLQHPDGSTGLARVLAAEAFDGKMYAAAEFADGSIHHYYDGTRIEDWDSVAADIADNHEVATALAVKIDAVDGFSAFVAGNAVTIMADAVDTPFTLTASAVNGGSVNDQTAGVTTVQSPSAAAAQISSVEIGGTFETADRFTITLDGTDYSIPGAAAGTGVSAQTFRSKVYSVVRSLLYFSALNDPTQWFIAGEETPPLGAGFINMGNQADGAEELIATAVYQGLLAIFARNSVQIWTIVEDEDSNAYSQTLSNTGTRAPRSVLSYGNNDVFYLHDSGVRSIRARDTTNTAYVTDAGTALDTFLQQYMATLSETQIAQAVAIMEPQDNRYWLALGQRIFVFSYFPGSKITAWSYYDVADDIGADITEFARIGRRIFARAGDMVYVYGGLDGATYPDADVAPLIVETPFLSGKTPATIKNILGFDAAFDGTFDVRLLPAPNNEAVELRIGVLEGITFNAERDAIEVETAVAALKFTSKNDGQAGLANFALHYDGPHEAG